MRLSVNNLFLRGSNPQSISTIGSRHVKILFFSDKVSTEIYTTCICSFKRIIHRQESKTRYRILVGGNHDFILVPCICIGMDVTESTNMALLGDYKSVRFCLKKLEPQREQNLQKVSVGKNHGNNIRLQVND